MNITEKPINEINPYKNNPRNNDAAVDKVAASIREFGFKVPIVIDKNNIVVTGHTRLKAAKQLGFKTVPVIVADDLTPEQIKAFRLVDNKTAEFAKWDMELLESELCDIDIDVDMADFGFELSDDIPIIENDIESSTTKDGQYDKLKMPINIGKLLFFMSVDEQNKYSTNMGIFYDADINDSEPVAELCKQKAGELADEIFNLLQAK